MMGHNMCFNGKIWIIIPKLPLLPPIWNTGDGLKGNTMDPLIDEAVLNCSAGQ